jgi:hypothetical protein
MVGTVITDGLTLGINAALREPKVESLSVKGLGEAHIDELLEGVSGRFHISCKGYRLKMGRCVNECGPQYRTLVFTER